MAVVMIGVDPHKASHTAVAISPAELAGTGAAIMRPSPGEGPPAAGEYSPPAARTGWSHRSARCQALAAWLASAFPACL
jgi:hypothetical protein